MKRLTALLAFVFPSLCFSQVEVDEKIIMQGTMNSSRQVKNLGNPTALQNAINAEAVQNNTINYTASTGTDTLVLNLFPSPTTYKAGLLVNLKSTSTVNTSAKININNLGVKPIYKAANRTLDSADILNGQLVTLIYDGSAFQMLSQGGRSCPPGFTSVSDRFCVELTPSSGVTFFQAVKSCNDRNARLCTWGEWYLACKDSTLNGSSGYLSNFEWVDSAANNGADAKVTGNSPTITAGSGGCTNSYSLPANSTTWLVNYRCCYSKQ